jgi:penicillin-insensitive murein endopeptidase
MESKILQLQPKDSRKYFMLPQAPQDAGYYVYGLLNGRPSDGEYQYAHPSMMTAILRVEREWQAIDDRRFGVGDISLAGGIQTPDHQTHRKGLEVDVRPLRKDGREEGVRWTDTKHYDKDGTAILIGLFRIFAPVVLIYFNDPLVPGVSKMVKHDDHFHVLLRG